MQTHHALALIPAAVAVLCVIAAAFIVYQERSGRLGRQQAVYKSPYPATGYARVPSKRSAPLPQRQLPVPPPLSPFPLSPQPLPPPPPSSFSLPEESAQVAAGSATPLSTPPPSPPDSRSAWQRFAEDDLQTGQLEAPKAQPRVPLTVQQPREQVVKLKRLTFQSEQRDFQVYPTPSFYRLQMAVPMRNVVSVMMSNGAIPLSEYLVNEYTQWLDVEYLGVVYQVQMPLGDWQSAVGLYATTLQTAMIAAGLPATLTVTSDVDTQRFTFATNNGNPWRFLMRTGPNVNRSMWQIIGFPRVDTELATVLRAPNNLDFQGTYAVELFIDEISCHLESADNMVAHMILQKFAAASVTTYKSPPDAGYFPGLTRSFPPIGRLQFLTFRFLVSYTVLNPGSDVPVQTYRPYMANGRNHTMQIDFGCKEYYDVLQETVELDPQS